MKKLKYVLLLVGVLMLVVGCGSKDKEEEEVEIEEETSGIELGEELKDGEDVTGGKDEIEETEGEETEEKDTVKEDTVKEDNGDETKEVGSIFTENESKIKVLGYKDMGSVKVEEGYTLDNFEVRFLEYEKIGEQDQIEFDANQQEVEEGLRVVRISYDATNKNEGKTYLITDVEKIVLAEDGEYISDEDYIGGSLDGIIKVVDNEKIKTNYMVRGNYTQMSIQFYPILEEESGDFVEVDSVEVRF